MEIAHLKPEMYTGTQADKLPDEVALAADRYVYALTDAAGGAVAEEAVQRIFLQALATSIILTLSSAERTITASDPESFLARWTDILQGEFYHASGDYRRHLRQLPDLAADAIGIGYMPESHPLKSPPLGTSEERLWLDVTRSALLFAHELIRSVDLTKQEGRNKLSTAFDHAVGNYQNAARYAGEFSTPPAIARLMAELSAPLLRHRVYDPCFGTGSLLVEALRYASAKEAHLRAPSESTVTPKLPVRGFAAGVEIQQELSLIAAARLSLIGEAQPSLTAGNAFLDNQPNELYDRILAHPPYGGRIAKWAPERSGLPFPAVDTDALFVQLIAQKLAPGGRAVVLVSEGQLFRSGIMARLRKWLLDAYRVEAVIALPEGALKPLTSVRSSILIFSRQPPLDDVAFVGSDFTRRWLLPAAEAGSALSAGGAGSPDHMSAALRAVMDFRSTRGDAASESATGTLARQELGAELDRLDAAMAALSALPVYQEPERWQNLSRDFGDVLDLAELGSGLFPEASADEEYPAVGQERTGIRSSASSREPGAWIIPVHRLAEREYELVAKPPASNPLKALLEEFRANGAQILPLSEAAQVIAGLPTDSQHVAEGEKASAEHLHVPLVRVSDVSRASVRPDRNGLPLVRRGGWWVRHKGLERTRQAQRLRLHDVLLTISATVGAVAWVDEETITGIPAKGVAIIRPLPLADAGGAANRMAASADPADAQPLVRPDYLLRLFQSEPYQRWFTDHAWGTTIRHLPLSTLRGIPIPVPSYDVQGFLAEALRGGESTATLLSLRRRAGGALYWQHFIEIAQELRQVRNLVAHSSSAGLPMEDDADALWEIVESWLERAGEWRARAERDRESEPTAGWLLRWTHAAEELAAIRRLPLGADRYAVLNVWRDRHAAVQDGDDVPTFASGPADEPVATRAVRLAATESTARIAPYLNRALRGLHQQEERLLLEACELQVDIAPSLIEAGKEAAVQLVIRNRGALGLRNLSLRATTLDNTVAGEQLHFLAAGASHYWGVTLPPPTPGPVILSVTWRAQRLDGSSWQGTAQVALAAGSEGHTTGEGEAEDGGRAEDTLGKSPYVVGGAIDSPGDFYGREPQIKSIRRLLRPQGAGSVVLLEGNRRAGKTSLLYQLRHPGVLDGFITAYFSLQSGSSTDVVAGLRTGEILYNIARELILAGHEAGLTFDLFGADATEQVTPDLAPQTLKRYLIRQVRPIFREEFAFEVLDNQIDTLCAAAYPRRLLLMLDEFDKIQEGIDSGITSPQLPENIRNLFHEHAGLSGILTGSRRIQRLREEYWHALFGIGMRVAVTALDEEPARRLVTEPAADRLLWAPAAVDHVLHLTARQPFLIQSLCSHVFARCSDVGTRNVTIRVVDEAGERLAEDFEHFRTLWNYLGTERRRFLLCLVDRLGAARDRVTLQLLADRAYELRVPYGRRLLKSDLDELRELELVEQVGRAAGSPEYRIAVPLLTRWMRHNTDFERQRDDAIEEPEDIARDR